MPYGCKKDQKRYKEEHPNVTAVLSDGKLMVKIENDGVEQLLTEYKISEQYKLIPIKNDSAGVGLRLVLTSGRHLKNQSETLGSGSMWIVRPERYIMDGTAIAACNVFMIPRCI